MEFLLVEDPNELHRAGSDHTLLPGRRIKPSTGANMLTEIDKLSTEVGQVS